MANTNLKAELDALMNGAYDVSPLKVDSKIYGSRYTPNDGEAPLLTTNNGELLCKKTPGLLSSVLIDRAYADTEPVYDGLHSRVYKFRNGVAVKEFKQGADDYFESNVEKAAKLKGLRIARMPEPYFAKGAVFAMEYVGGIPMSSLRERSEACYENVYKKLVRTAAFERMVKNDFNLAGERHGLENLLVVMKNGKVVSFYPIDQDR